MNWKMLTSYIINSIFDITWTAYMHNFSHSLLRWFVFQHWFLLLYNFYFFSQLLKLTISIHPLCFELLHDHML